MALLALTRPATDLLAKGAPEVSQPGGAGAGGDVQLCWADHLGAENCSCEAFFRTSYLIEPTKMQGSPVGFGHAYQLDLSLLSFIIIHNSSCFLSQIEINQTPKCLLSFVSGKNKHHPLQGLDTSSREGALRLMRGFQLVGGALHALHAGSPGMGWGTEGHTRTMEHCLFGKTLRKCLECSERWEAMKQFSWQVLKLY